MLAAPDNSVLLALNPLATVSPGRSGCEVQQIPQVSVTSQFVRGLCINSQTFGASATMPAQVPQEQKVPEIAPAIAFTGNISPLRGRRHRMWDLF